MVINVLISLWVVFLVVVITLIAKKMLNHSYSYAFQNYDKTDIIYITVDVQGFMLNLLVDTGCGVSIISQEVLNQVQYKESPRKIQLAALTSDSLHSSMVTIPIVIKGKQIEEDFVTYDKQDIANFQANYGITIHGILGNEFLEKTGCQIDYKNHKVIIP